MAALGSTSLRQRRTAAARRHPLRPFASHTPVVIVPGLRDSGPQHWQTLWHRRHADFLRAAPDAVDVPALDEWASAIADVLAKHPPALVVAHSFGCLATLRAAQAHGCTLAGALLVAPADPDRFGIDDLIPHAPLSFPATLVASTDDPWLKLVKAGLLASRWGCRLECVGAAGHINAESGLGDWPAGFALLRDLAERAAAAGTLAARAAA